MDLEYFPQQFANPDHVDLDGEAKTDFERRPQTCHPPYLPMPEHPLPQVVAKHRVLRRREIKNPMDLRVPNCRDWSIGEVCWYFHHYFNSKVAKLFFYHEIDGFALLLMDKDNVTCDLRKLFVPEVDGKLTVHFRTIPRGTMAQVWIHVSCLQHRRNAYDLFFRSMTRCYQKQYIYPGDYLYIGHPKDF